MKNARNVFSDQFERLKEKVTWRADQLGIDLTEGQVIEGLLTISEGANDADGNMNEAWEAVSWPERIFAIAFRCSTNDIFGGASDSELIEALCLGSWAIGFVDGLPGEKSDPSVCVSCLLKQHMSTIGKTGIQKRWAAKSKLEAWAVEKYRAKKWASANKAAHHLKDQVREYGRTIGAAPLTEENAQRTIADWFRKANKSG